MLAQAASAADQLESDFRRANYDLGFFLYKSGKGAQAEQALFGSIRAKPGSAAWNLESARLLVRVAVCDLHIDLRAELARGGDKHIPVALPALLLERVHREADDREEGEGADEPDAEPESERGDDRLEEARILQRCAPMRERPRIFQEEEAEEGEEEDDE